MFAAQLPLQPASRVGHDCLAANGGHHMDRGGVVRRPYLDSLGITAPDSLSAALDDPEEHPAGSSEAGRDGRPHEAELCQPATGAYAPDAQVRPGDVTPRPGKGVGGGGASGAGREIDDPELRLGRMTDVLPQLILVHLVCWCSRTPVP